MRLFVEMTFVFSSGFSSFFELDSRALLSDAAAGPDQIGSLWKLQAMETI
jgi:hypothetical protein